MPAKAKSKKAEDAVIEKGTMPQQNRKRRLRKRF